MNKLLFWKNNIKKKMCDCFVTFFNFIFENEIEVRVDNDIIISISDH